MSDAEFAAVDQRLRELWLAMGDAAPQSVRLATLYAEVRALEERLRRAGVDPLTVPDFTSNVTVRVKSTLLHKPYSTIVTED